MENPIDNIGEFNDKDALMFSDILRSEDVDNVSYGALLRPTDDAKVVVISVIDAGEEVDVSEESGLYTIKQLLPEATEDQIMMAESMINGYQMMSTDDIPLFPDKKYLLSALMECGAIMFLSKYFN